MATEGTEGVQYPRLTNAPLLIASVIVSGRGSDIHYSAC